MGSHIAGSTPARASAQLGDRRFACRYRVIDSTISRPSAATRSPVNHSPAARRTWSMASARTAAWLFTAGCSFTAGSGGPVPVGVVVGVVGVMARSCPTTHRRRPAEGAVRVDRRGAARRGGLAPRRPVLGHATDQTRIRPTLGTPHRDQGDQQDSARSRTIPARAGPADRC